MGVSRPTSAEKLEEGVSSEAVSRRSRGWSPRGSAATPQTASATQRLARKRRTVRKLEDDVCRRTRQCRKDFLFFLVNVDSRVNVSISLQQHCHRHQQRQQQQHHQN